MITNRCEVYDYDRRKLNSGNAYQKQLLFTVHFKTIMINTGLCMKQCSSIVSCAY
jgi:hypothetical protein